MLRCIAPLVALVGCDGVFGLDRVSPGVDAGPPICPVSYDLEIAATSSRYRFVSTATTWTAAQETCAADRAPGSSLATHLAVISSDAEAAELLEANRVDIWIGLTDRVNNESFIWITAEDTRGFPPSSGDPWAPFEPKQRRCRRMRRCRLRVPQPARLVRPQVRYDALRCRLRV